MLTLWGNDKAFIEKYLSDTPGYYTTGDAGVIDSKGYLHIMTRMDDVINTAGHRISTGRLEEVVSVVESAVVGYNHELRGEYQVCRGKARHVQGVRGRRNSKLKMTPTNYFFSTNEY